MRFGTVSKAIYAALVAGLGSLTSVLVGHAGFGDVTAGQWVTVALAALLAGGGVYRIPNTPLPPTGGGKGAV